MEWVAVNDMLTANITKLNYTLIPPGFHGDVRSVRLMQDSLSKVIDVLGEQSATAQGLKKVITTAEKLRNSPAHILYLLKDARAKSGKGDVIGLLKVGRKHLFLFDEDDKVREVEPLCILDFFVLNHRQRHGYGKVLFDHMLQDMETTAQELAVDGPSPKMEQFLNKNYGVERLVRQNNNFAIAPQFFKSAIGQSPEETPPVTPVVAPAVGRFTAHKPASAIGNVIHGGGSYHQNESRNGVSKPTTPEPDTCEPEAAPEPKPQVDESQPEPAPAPESNKSPERPSTLSVEPIAECQFPIPSPAGSTISRRDSQLTDRGFFDVKFYHNKLW